MSSQTILNLVIGVAILGLLIYRQLRARPVRGNQRVVLALAVIGLIETVLGYDCLVGLHKGIGGIGGATLVLYLAVLYLAVTLGVQRLVVVVRAQRLDPAGFRRIGPGAI